MSYLLAKRIFQILWRICNHDSLDKSIRLWIQFLWCYLSFTIFVLVKYIICFMVYELFLNRIVLILMNNERLLQQIKRWHTLNLKIPNWLIQNSCQEGLSRSADKKLWHKAVLLMKVSNFAFKEKRNKKLYL